MTSHLHLPPIHSGPLMKRTRNKPRLELSRMKPTHQIHWRIQTLSIQTLLISVPMARLDYSAPITIFLHKKIAMMLKRHNMMLSTIIPTITRHLISSVLNRNPSHGIHTLVVMIHWYHYPHVMISRQLHESQPDAQSSRGT